MPAFEVAAFLRAIAGRAHLGAHHRAGDLLAGAAAAGLRRAPTPRPSAPCRTAARRSPRTWCTASSRRSRRRGSATASGSPRPRRCRPTCRTSDAAEHADSVGFAGAGGRRASSTDADPDSGVGELLVRGPHVVAGYWSKPEQTAETFVDGWLHSGDLARIDDDGLVYIVDRKKDMINRGGENVYCVEVENALAAHPDVGEVAVIGVAGRDDGREGRRGRGPAARAAAGRRPSWPPSRGSGSPTSRSRSTSSSASSRCPATPAARCSSRSLREQTPGRPLR